MLTILIVGHDKNKQEQKLNQILSPFGIDPIDITKIEPKQSLGIAQIRQLQHTASLTPFYSSKKAVVVTDAHLLTIEAQNALLKTLEEPPEHTIIILLASTLAAFLPTVLSRCKIIVLQPKNDVLDKKTLQEANNELDLLLNMSLGQLLEKAEMLAKDQEKSIDWLTKMMYASREKLLSKTLEPKHDQNVPKILELLANLQKTHTMLTNTNVNIRMAIENLMLSLEKD